MPPLYNKDIQNLVTESVVNRCLKYFNHLSVHPNKFCPLKRSYMEYARKNRLSKIAFIDESYGQLTKGITFSVLAASIFFDNTDSAKAKFLAEHIGSNPFKTSKCYVNRTLRKLRALMKWVDSNAFLNLIVINEHRDAQVELFRFFALETLLIELNSLNVSTAIVDSRHLPGTEDVEKMNRLDLAVHNKLRAQKYIERDFFLSHALDQDEMLLAAPDLVAWAARRHFIGEGSEYWNLIRDRTVVLDIRH